VPRKILHQWIEKAGKKKGRISKVNSGRGLLKWRVSQGRSFAIKKVEYRFLTT